MIPYKAVSPSFNLIQKEPKSGRPPKYPFKDMDVNTAFEVPLGVKYKSMQIYCYQMSSKLGKTFRLATFDGDHRLYVVRLA